MADSPVGSLTIRILAQVGDAPPHLLGTVQVPITTRAPAIKKLEVDLEQHYQTVGVMFQNVFAPDPPTPKKA